MSECKIKVRLNDGALNLLSKKVQRAIELTADQMITDIQQRQVVPAQTRTLERSVSVKKAILNKGNISLVYNTPYARRLYYHPEYNFSKDINRNAQGKWLEYYKSGEGAEWIKKVYTIMARREISR